MTVTITLEDGITPALQRALAGVSDLTPLMGDIAQYLFTQTKENFANERAPDGSVWAPKSPVTIANYRRQGLGPGRILFKEGPLSDSLAVDWGPDFAEVSVNQPYAAVHQFGATKGSLGSYSGVGKRGRYSGSSPWGNIPARPFLGIAEEQKLAITEIVQDYLESLFDGS